jgi:Zn finger protein HypA/HybF involved in hydrogenase expression
MTTTELKCKCCNYTFPSNKVELTNMDITEEYFKINWNCPKCDAEGLTLFINNTVNNNNDKGKNKK